jgi:RNA polymerase sigma-70 factor (ECF subfamily)
MTDQDDLDLVEKTVGGQTAAFEGLVRKYQKVIYNVALRMSNDADDAADITQDVFVKAFHKLSTFDRRYKFFSWLYRIAVNESLNFVRSKKRFESLDDPERSVDVSSDDKTDDALLLRQVDQALMELKPDSRIVIVLRHFHDLTYQDMSRLLDIPEKTVKSRLFTARQMLREILTRKGIASTS